MELSYQPELPKSPRPIVILGAGGIANDAQASRQTDVINTMAVVEAAYESSANGGAIPAFAH